MSLAVDGLLRVVTFETTLPPLKLVTVVFLTTGVTFFALRLRGVVAFLVGAVEGDLTGITKGVFVFTCILYQ